MAKTILITGASKGFGRIWAEAALERGDNVAATARNTADLEALVSKYGERVLDYTTLDSITSIPVGDDPHEIEVSPDGRTAYVSNAAMNAGGHTIHVLDLVLLKSTKIIDTRPFYVPHGLALRNDSLWFTAQGSKAVVVYDLKKDEPVQVLGTGQDFTHLIYLAPGQPRFYTTNVESGTVSIYAQQEIPPYMPPTSKLPAGAKPRLEWRQILVDVGVGAEGFDVSSDGKELWTARPDGHVMVVDLETEKLKADINTGVEGLHRLKTTPDGKSVAIVSVKTGDLLFYNAQSRALEKRLNIGQGAGIYMDGRSNRMFVSCTPNNAVVVVDLTSRKEIARIPVGRPDGVSATAR